MDKANGVVNSGGEEEREKDELIPTGPHRYSLPTLRYTNLFIALVMVDGIVSIALWLTGMSHGSNYCKRGNFLVRVILAFFRLLSSSQKLPPGENKIHIPLLGK